MIEGIPAKKKILDPQRWLITAILLANLTLLVAISWKASLYSPTNHIDGAYQTAAGLFKMKSGQIPGIEFFPYLGIGPIILLYPFFILFGSKLASTVFASHFVVLLIFELTFIFSLILLSKIRKTLNRLMLGFIPILIVTPAIWFKISDIGLTHYFGLDSLLELSNPGNSLRPLRSFAAWLLPIAIYAIHKRYGERRVGHVAIGFLTGLVGITWSNDFAIISAILGIFLYLAFVFIKAKEKGINFLSWALSLLLTIIILSMLLLKNGWRNSLFKYNFVDVRGDQFWYFAPWSIDSRVFSIKDLFSQIVREHALIPLILLFFLFGISVIRFSKSFLTMSAIGLGLFLGGCVATVGGHTHVYFSPFKVWGVYLILVFLISLFHFGISQQRRFSLEYLQRNLHFALATILIILALSQISNLVSSGNKAKVDSNIDWNNQLGGYINPAFSTESAFSEDEKLVEEYWGLASVFAPGEEENKVDSIIHALGDARHAYHLRLSGKNVRVVTSSPAVGSWFSWSFSANWWFYKDLFLKFSPVRNTPLTYLWLEDASFNKWEDIACEVAADKRSILLKNTENRMYNVFVEYSGPGKFSRRFSMIQNNLNYGGGGNGFMSIDPSSNSQEFPVIGETGSTRLYVKDISNSIDQVTIINSCHASEISFARDSKKNEIVNHFLQAADSPMDFTDSNWTSGVSNSVRAFFVHNTLNNRETFKVGKSIRFAIGEISKVSAVEINRQYINVFFNGDKFDPQIYGYPNKFRVLD
jgi:hypothetical protein